MRESIRPPYVVVLIMIPYYASKHTQQIKHMYATNQINTNASTVTASSIYTHWYTCNYKWQSKGYYIIVQINPVNMAWKVSGVFDRDVQTPEICYRGS